MEINKESTPIEEAVSQPNRGIISVIVGLVLVLPAACACLVSFLVPTAVMFGMSFQDIRMGLFGEGRFIGLENYSRMFGDKVYVSSWGFTLILILLNIVAFVLLPVGLALLVNRLKPGMQMISRLLFSLPLAFFSPIALALLWRYITLRNFGPLDFLLGGNLEGASAYFLIMDFIYMLGLGCGIGLIVYLTALRNGSNNGDYPAYEIISDTPPRKRSLSLLWISLISILAVSAAALQTYTLSQVMFGRMVSNPLMLYISEVTLRLFNFSYGAAMTVVLMIVLIIAGILAGVILVGTGMRIETTPAPKRTDFSLASGNGQHRLTLDILSIVVVLLSFLCLCFFSGIPYLWSTWGSMQNNAMAYLFDSIPIGRAFVNTYLPTMISVLVIQLPIAYLGAVGIGVMRPFGSKSEWLLLLFCPWLFVTLGPLGISLLPMYIELGLTNTFAGLINPIFLSVPMLIILTLFFKGQEKRYQAALQPGKSAVGAFFTQYLLPSLPLTLLLVGVAIIVGSQEYWWPLLVAVTPNLHTIPLALRMISTQLFNPSVLLAGLVLFGVPVSFLAFLFIAVFQVFYLDRLAIRTG